jgi:hypothetical protein
MGRAINQVNGDLFGMGGSGAMAFQLVKYKGAWAVERGMTTAGTGFGSKFYDVAKVLAAKVPRYSCEQGEVVQPTFTPAEIKSAAIDEAMRAGRTRDQAEAFAAAKADFQRQTARDQFHLHDAKKGIPFLAISNEQMESLKHLEDVSDLSNPNAAESGQASMDRYKLWMELQAQFPETPSDDQWIGLGTAYKVECHMHGSMCNYFHQQTKIGWKEYVVIQVTSGPHAGQYGLIDMRFLRITKFVGAGGLGGYGSVS